MIPPPLERARAGFGREREITRRLRHGRAVYVRAWGSSMTPALRPGERLRIAPVHAAAVRVSDIVLVEAAAGPRIHRVIALAGSRITTQGDAMPRPDPPAPAAAVLGRVCANLDAAPNRGWQGPPSRARRWFYSGRGVVWWNRLRRLRAGVVAR